eukprot:9198555-Alexandrium_andersonii.AAC.1
MRRLGSSAAMYGRGPIAEGLPGEGTDPIWQVLWRLALREPARRGLAPWRLALRRLARVRGAGGVPALQLL